MIATVSRSALLEELKLCELVKPTIRVMFGALIEARESSLDDHRGQFLNLLPLRSPSQSRARGFGDFLSGAANHAPGECHRRRGDAQREN